MSFKEKFNSFLNKLGGEEENKSPENKSKCPHCGANINENSEYCEYCKAKLENPKEENNLSKKLKNFANKVFVSEDEFKQSFKEDEDWQNK